MRNLLLAVSLTACMLANPSHAQFIPNKHKSAVSSIRVNIIDQTSEGCWTNLGESKRYAEDLLRLKNYNVVQSNAKYRIDIYVNGNRFNGLCVAHISIELFTVVRYDGMEGGFSASNLVGLWWHPANLNNTILDSIKKFTDLGM